jgi:NAD(P)H-dependent FMN reductase
MLDAIARSDAVWIASPEYGHSLTGVLKNAIDWTIGAGALAGKIVGVACAVPHEERGRLGRAALMQSLGAIDARVVVDRAVVTGAGFERGVDEVIEALRAAWSDAGC